MHGKRIIFWQFSEKMCLGEYHFPPRLILGDTWNTVNKVFLQFTELFVPITLQLYL